jgi:hypothetical protein
MKPPYQDMDTDGDDNETGDGRPLKTGGKKRTRKASYTLEVDDDGKPIIPDFSESNLESKKAIIRAFITSHYSTFSACYHERVLLTGDIGLCSGKPKVAVPWSAIRDKESQFVSQLYLPTDVNIKDPSKLQSSEADALLDYWNERQRVKVGETFMFSAWMDNNKELQSPVGHSDSTSSVESEESDGGEKMTVPARKSARAALTTPDHSDDDEDHQDDDDEGDLEPDSADDSDNEIQDVVAKPIARPKRSAIPDIAASDDSQEDLPPTKKGKVQPSASRTGGNVGRPRKYMAAKKVVAPTTSDIPARRTRSKVPPPGDIQPPRRPQRRLVKR